MRLHKATVAKSLLIFLLAAIVVAITYPSKVRFLYDYTLGQPWRYEGVLTAPYSFPVYKSDAMRVAERDSVERSRISYFKLQPEQYIKEKNRLTKEHSQGLLPSGLSSKHIAYLFQAMEQVYSSGIISSEAYSTLLSGASPSIYLIDDHNVAKRRLLTDIYTPKEAYEYILEHFPYPKELSILQDCQLERYLVTNLVLDEEKTTQMHNARLASLTDVIGEVQKGERIIGQGDVVTPAIFQELEAYKRAHEGEKESKVGELLLLAGQFVLILLLFMVLYSYLYFFRPDLLKRYNTTLFLVILVGLFAILTYLIVPIEPSTIYMIPYCMVPILVRIFLDSRTAGITHMVVILLAALAIPSQMEFLILQFIAARVVITTLQKLSQRSDLIRTSFAVFFSMILVYVAYMLANEGEAFRMDWSILFYFAINFIFLMFTYVLVYVIERAFGFVSNISLVELADINKPLLQQLSEVAPGTFQHSLNVGTLASAAVEEIGGDARLVRAGAYYHDIGKMKNPNYFTENQGSTNPHDQLSYDESARMIIKHVTDGLEMAEKAKLPKPIQDFIRTHHGLGMTKYFYVQYKNEHPDEEVNESLFRYPGPNPFTLEQGVLMLADAVEASSRSLKVITEQILSEHINKIVGGILTEGLLKDTPLTFRNIETIKYVFGEKLRNMYHSRIDYPELKKPSASGEKPAEAEAKATTETPTEEGATKS